MKGSFPIITCDDESGCDQWTLDWYEGLASNWRELLAPGWSYDPYARDGEQRCPDHARTSVPPSSRAVTEDGE